MKKEFFKTHDGSYTLFLPQMNETYHSKFGAVNEAVHVFIQAGFLQLKKPKVKILEIGFGTGLNVFLTLKKFLTQKNINEVFFQSLEKFPLDTEIISKLNYHTNEKEKELFNRIHRVEWNKEIQITEGFFLQKQQADLLGFNAETSFDLVYFDAFAPDKQPELWTVDVFRNMYKHLNPEGILVTYSAKGQVRRNMIEAGFTVERIPGPPGKREMLRAIKK